MPFGFAVVCEAAADFRTATGLAERIIREHVGWVDDHLLATCPLWLGAGQSRPYLLWTEVRKLAKEAGIPPIHGHFDNRPAEPDARTALRALRLLRLKNLERPLDGVLLIRDDDRDARRRAGLEQARDADDDLRDRIVIGLAHSKRECWVLAGFEPTDIVEEDHLTKIRAELGFDPRTHSHQLTAKHDADTRSAKRVVGVLTQDDADREAICWEKAHLAVLRERGQATGLAEFMDEVILRLVPLFDGRPPA